MVWSPKRGPLATTGRLLHLAVGFLLPVAGGHWFGYKGAAWGLTGALVGGLLWEISTSALAPAFGWTWPHGDIVDALAVVIGAVVGVISWLAVWRKSKA